MRVTEEDQKNQAGYFLTDPTSSKDGRTTPHHSKYKKIKSEKGSEKNVL